MRLNFLKAELVLLFLLSTISCIFYFFGSNLPDHSLSIASSNTLSFDIIYYLSSFLAKVSFYVGPWICLPFVIYSFIYTFLLSRRSRSADMLIGPLLAFFFFNFFFLFFPTFVGSGLRHLADGNLNTYFVLMSSLVFGITIFYLTLQGTFFTVVKKLQIFIDTSQAQVASRCSALYLGMKKTNLKAIALEKKVNFTQKTIGALKKTDHSKGDEKSAELQKTYTPLVKDNSKLNSSVDDETSSFDDTEILNSADVSSVKSDAFNISENLEPTSSDNEDSAVVSASEQVTPVKTLNRSSVVDNSFFNTEELIGLINPMQGVAQNKEMSESYFQFIINAIESKLTEFKFDAKIINVLKGPVVDTFELELGSGVKVSKVRGLSDDISLALEGAPIRIVYPMRGKSTIGIEVPRNPRDFIFLDEVLQSKSFDDSNQRLPIAMGKDAFGEVKIVDLAGMPHMLVAGATGAGKSVFINTLLVSLIVKKSPRELKLILIDPKQLELALFQDLPHLMLPVVTDPTSSSIALLWAVQEMDRRYSILKELGVKNIEGFNKKIKSCDESYLFKINQYYEEEKDDGYELPYIVIVIDEFADLILSKAGKEIEINVNRLAAKARAAGIHLVVATQRPSTDVVTGVIKANFPTRVAFRVSVGHDSKTILDQYGAEKLLGKGDMLYKHGVDLLRLHSSFVEEPEIEGLIEKLATIPKTYNQNAVDFLENGGEEIEDEIPNTQAKFTSGTADDPIYAQALDVVFEQGSASASMLQRRLRIGYNRAANIVEEMERNGVVGPAQGSKPRKLIARAD